MPLSIDTRRGRTEAYERMRVSEDRVRALRGQTTLMKQSLKSAKKSAKKAPNNESPYQRSYISSPAKNQAQLSDTPDTVVFPDEFVAPLALQYNMLDSKQYT